MARRWESRNDRHVSLTQVVELLVLKISAMIKHPRKEWVNWIPLLLGEAGIGKTTVLLMMADLLEKRTGQPWRAMMIHAATQGMEDNTGLPILKKVGAIDVAGWAAPMHIPGAVPWTDEKGEPKGWTLGIIDELPTSPLLIQDQIRQLIDGMLPGSSTPVDPRCVYVATGNPPDPQYVTVNAMDAALEKRLKVYVVIPTTEELLLVWSKIMPDLFYQFLSMNTAAITELSPREWMGVAKDVQYLIESGLTVQNAISEAADELSGKDDVLAALRKFVQFGNDPYYYPIRGSKLLAADDQERAGYLKLMARWASDRKDGLLGATSNDLMRSLKTSSAESLSGNKQAEQNVFEVLEFLAGAERADMVKAILEVVFETPLVGGVSSRMRTKSKHLKTMDATVVKSKALRGRMRATSRS
jgi:hypothetical protein